MRSRAPADAALAAVAAAAAIVVLAAMAGWGPTVRHALETEAIQPVGGASYSAPADLAPPAAVLFAPILADINAAPDRSPLTVSEDGAALPFPHSAHAEIQSEGAGRYSHWGGAGAPIAVFSATDNSDPRVNGRQYVLSATTPVTPRAGLAAFAVLLVAAGALAWRRRSAISSGIVRAARRGRGMLAAFDSQPDRRPLALAAVALAALAAFWLGALIAADITGLSTVRISLDPAQISVRSDGAYQASLPVAPPPGLTLPSDSNAAPRASDIGVLEDGVRMGPPHSAHADIAALGGGRYSHWDGATLIFSTSDNSDPRANGRVYQVELPYSAPAWVYIGFWLLLVGLACYRFRRPLPALTARHGVVIDAAMLAVFLALSVVSLTTLMALYGRPAIVASTDAGNILAMAAAGAFPDRFQLDFMLNDPANTDFYVSLFGAFVALLARFGGDFGQAYLWTQAPLVFLQLAAFYFLGRRLYGSRWWGAVLALLSYPAVWIWGRGELWGVFHLPLVRMTFGAALPLLMLLFLKWGSRTRLLPLLFLACGLTIYLHPPSTPAMAVGLWLASFALKPVDEPVWRRAAWLAGSGMVFVLSVLPFAFNFFDGFAINAAAAAPTASQEAAAAEYFRGTIGSFYTDAGLAVRMAVARLWDQGGLFGGAIYLSGVAGMIVAMRGNARRREGAFLLLCLCGVVLGSAGAAALDQTVSGLMGRAPFQADLIRGLRLAVPILLMGHVLLLAGFADRWRTGAQTRRLAPLWPGLAVLVVGFWWTVHPTRVSEALGVNEIEAQYNERQDPDAAAVIAWLRARPADGAVLALSDPLFLQAVRYGALQPLVYGNDENFLFYAGSPKRFEWLELNALVEGVRGEESAAALDSLLARTRPRYVVLDAAFGPALRDAAIPGGREIYRNARFTVVDLAYAAGGAGAVANQGVGP